MKDSTLLNYIYSILTDKKTMNRFAFTGIRDKVTLESAGLCEAQELIKRLYDTAKENEKAEAALKGGASG